MPQQAKSFERCDVTWNIKMLMPFWSLTYRLFLIANLVVDGVQGCHNIIAGAGGCACRATSVTLCNCLFSPDAVALP